MRGLRNLILSALAMWTSGASWASDVPARTRHTTTVTVSGTGASREAAIRDALQVAVQQVLGGQLASLTEVRDGKLSAQHIHFHTNGVVERYELLAENCRANRVDVQLRADVRRGAGTVPSGKNVDGRRLQALAETRHFRRSTASSAWTDLIEHWGARTTAVHPMATEPRRVLEDTDEIELKQTLQVTVDRTRYGQAVTELRPLLDSVASAQGQFVAWMVPESAPEMLPLQRARLPHPHASGPGLEWLRCGTVRTCRGMRVTGKGTELPTAAPADSKSLLIFLQRETAPSTSIESWQWYLVPMTASFQPPRTELQMTLGDEQRGTLQRRIWQLGCQVPGYSYQPQTFGRDLPSIVLAPAWVAHTGTTSKQESLISTRTVTLVVTLKVPLEQVPRIRRVEAQLVTAPRWEPESDKRP